jgi:hypothetical protein
VAAPLLATHLEIHGPSAQIRGGQSFQFRATRVAPEGSGPRNVRWTVVGPGSIAQDTGMYVAPLVDQRVEVTVVAVDPDGAATQSFAFSVEPGVRVEGGTPVLGDAADGKGPGFAPARSAFPVTLQPHNATITTDAGPLPFSARVEGAAEQPEWTFRIREAEQLGPAQCGQMLRDGQGQWRYHPPVVAFGREVYTIQAFAKGRPEIFGETKVEVGNGLLFGKVMNAFDPDWLEPRMVHFSGDPVEAGQVSGSSLESRFRDLRGLVKLSRHAPKGLEDCWLAADARNHALVALGPDGSSRVWLGGQGSGHQDGKAGEARFNVPSDLAIPPACQEGREPWRCIIVDCLNHVLRQVDAEGTVTTLAGVPGVRGFQDGPALEARFRIPYGVAITADGTILVTDTGNGLIRRIQGDRVATVAGSIDADPPERKEDGKASAEGAETGASMLVPLALALDERSGCLYVADGRAILRIQPSGRVDPVMDGTDEGFEGKGPSGPSTAAAVPDITRAERRAAEIHLGIRRSLACHRGLLFICDWKNPSVRVWNPATGGSSLLLGELNPGPNGPASPPIRFGPIRPGRDGLAAGRLAVVQGPSRIAFDPEGGCLLAMETCLAEVTLDWKALPGHGAGDSKGPFVPGSPGGGTGQAPAAGAKAPWSASERQAGDSKASDGDPDAITLAQIMNHLTEDQRAEFNALSEAVRREGLQSWIRSLRQLKQEKVDAAYP